MAIYVLVTSDTGNLQVVEWICFGGDGNADCYGAIAELTLHA